MRHTVYRHNLTIIQCLLTLKIFPGQIKLLILQYNKKVISNNLKIYRIMKVNRNYRFVLTVLDNDKIEAGEARIENDAVSGERMFVSECHYYAEKNIIEALKAAEKADQLESYYGHTYCIYKEDKPKKEVEERQEGNKKIVETREIPGAAMLVEVITIDECGVTIK